MSRPLVLAELSTGPKSHAELHAASRRAGAISKSVGGLHEMLTRRGEVSFALSEAGHRVYFLTPAGAEAAKAIKPRGPKVPPPKRNRPDPRHHGRRLGVVYETVSINAAARACATFAAYYGSALVVLTPERECSVYVDGSVAASRAWNNVADVVGVWNHDGADRARSQEITTEIADALSHQIDLHAARPVERGTTTGASAPTLTGVPQS